MTLTTANVSFSMNVVDVELLLDFHKKQTGTKQGRRWNVEVLNKSAIVLLCAAWEAYAEDVVGVVVEHFVEHAPNADSLPHELRKKITGELTAKGETHRIWELAGDGWRKLLRTRLDTLKVERDRSLNTPKAEQLRVMFRHNTGLADLTKQWKWKGMEASEACKRLDEFVELRGAIAHRVNAPDYVYKDQVERALVLVQRLVRITDGAMNELALQVTGKPLPDDSPDGRAAAASVKVDGEGETEAVGIGPT